MSSRSGNRTRSSSRSGYTLVEMVVVMVILGIVGLVAAVVLLESMRVYARIVPAMDASYKAQHAVQRMKREIRGLKDAASISSLTTSAFTFADTSDQTVSYVFTGSDLTRNGDLLADGVRAMNFSYFQKDGSPAASPADLHLVEVDLTVQNGDELSRVQTPVFPRNLGGIN